MSNSAPANYYWDTCVFTAHLVNERHQHGNVIDDIQQFLGDAHAGRCRIYTSTITIAEITSPTLATSNVGSFQEFLRDFRGVVIAVDPSPVLMEMASHLRSQDYRKGEVFRKLGTADAIHLATAVGLSEIYGVDLEAFHTFDRGKRRGEEGGRGLPLIGFEEWSEGCMADPMVAKVRTMRRGVPLHPSPNMLAGG